MGNDVLTPQVKRVESLSERELPHHHTPPLLTQWQRSPHEEWPPLPCDGQGTHPPWPGQEEGWSGCSLGPQAEGRWEEKETVERMGQMKQKRQSADGEARNITCRGEIQWNIRTEVLIKEASFRFLHYKIWCRPTFSGDTIYTNLMFRKENNTVLSRLNYSEVHINWFFWATQGIWKPSLQYKTTSIFLSFSYPWFCSNSKKKKKKRILELPALAL